MQLQRQRTKSGSQNAAVSSTTTRAASSSSTSISLSDALSRPYVRFSSASIKPAKLTLTPHHLFYLLTKFEDLGVQTGPLTIRLENLHSAAAPSNYVSFLGHAPKSRGKQSDVDSLKSVSSVRSVMSSVSSLWSSFSLTNAASKAEKQMAQHREDIRYLYSCFTKIPALKLAPDHRARVISGFEEFPFDTAVPLFVFKNLSILDICDLDFRNFHGWDRLAEQLRSLSVKRANLDDPLDLLHGIVLDDMGGRRKRSPKMLGTGIPHTPSTPGVGWSNWPSSSPKSRQVELSRSFSSPTSTLVEKRRSSLSSANALTVSRGGSSDGVKTPATHQHTRQRSSSPGPPISRHGSLRKTRQGTLMHRRSSSNSGSSTHEDGTPRHSTIGLDTLPTSKWRFLRHLGLADNGLTSLTIASLAPVADTLQSLDLSGNLFVEIPDALASLTHLRALNLSNCMIDSLASLTRHPLPAITTLNLRSNRLASLAGIEKIRTLERLDLRDNALRDPTELARLTDALDIIDLYVAKNPFARTHPNYRVVIFTEFRKAPGQSQDPTIDTLAPTSSELKLLPERPPHVAQVPVIRPPVEDEEPQTATGAADALAKVDDHEYFAATHAEQSPRPHTHRRSTSDTGALMTPRRRRAPRRRIVELSQQESAAGDKILELAPDVLDAPPPQNNAPATPEPTPYHTAPTRQAHERQPLPRRSITEAAYDSPTPVPRFHGVIEDEYPPPPLPPKTFDSTSDLYRQKIEALKQDLGPNWLSALGEERRHEQETRERSFSPASRASTVRPDVHSRGVSVNGMTTG